MEDRAVVRAGIYVAERDRVLTHEEVRLSQTHIDLALINGRYYLFLLVAVLFIFLLTTSYWAIVQDLADAPMKVRHLAQADSLSLRGPLQIPEKLANGLQGSNARNFMVSYVMLQGKSLRL
jgi:hypothetical protein